MKFDLWVVAIETDADPILGLLPNHQIAVVEPKSLAESNGHGDRPAAIVVTINSWRSGCQSRLLEACSHADTLPMVIVDATFDGQLARKLAVCGVHDYLRAEGLTVERLSASIEIAIVRHGHQAARHWRPLIEARPDLNVERLRAIAATLPDREREVFDLMITCLPTAELAAKLGKSNQTIRNQITNLKQRFGVESRQELIVISILCLPTP